MQFYYWHSRESFFGAEGHIIDNCEVKGERGGGLGFESGETKNLDVHLYDLLTVRQGARGGREEYPNVDEKKSWLQGKSTSPVLKSSSSQRVRGLL